MHVVLVPVRLNVGKFSRVVDIERAYAGVNDPVCFCAAGTELSADPVDLSNADHWVRMSLGQMIFAGVFERFPRLRNQ